MNKIRTKLLVYFVAILVLMIALFFIQHQNSQRIIDLHNQRLDKYFLLNEITQQTDQTYQSLQIYVNETTEENHQYFQENYQEFKRLQHKFDSTATHSVDNQNYMNLLSSFIDLMNNTTDAVDAENIDQSSHYYNEAGTTASYIHEKTLELINNELTAYEKIVSLENQRMQNIRNMSTAVFLSVILLSILFALWFSNGITRTINKLTNAAKEIATGNYQINDIFVSRKDELRLLTDTFNQMKFNVVEAIREMKEKARLNQLLKEMELQSLQNQMNPHFLFNTLNTISKTAYIEGAEQTNELISSTSKLLRYNIGNLDKETYLKDEVNVVNEYFFIQQTRFGDRVSFRQYIDQQCLSIPMPRLTLQPLVENAFIHGIENMATSGEIRLNIYQKQQTIMIEIIDNGKGMSQEKVNRLLGDGQSADGTQQKSGHSTGIGLRNVIDYICSIVEAPLRLNQESE
ncbi:hypothetical protein Pryu01_00755 [Paraliobacillus ryukyuensis]|uniref:Histidine kinase/DNA gyrase B/HSP90-like ATPase n=1 Tax=Paraliobacillus ryukyuensis TaxID=200904 RepID=A0A366EE54_9BACI|nr:histidine kinase [Paraliobacillus ryukyuensis]RBP00672.1 histidine kinase/DNA gyrase B/HSP90-like ATPase [Paraliobacillus ryukyuensis]